jgi:hypothetical protein
MSQVKQALAELGNAARLGNAERVRAARKVLDAAGHQLDGAGDVVEVDQAVSVEQAAQLRAAQAESTGDQVQARATPPVGRTAKPTTKAAGG